MTFKYQEEFELALKTFHQSALYDPMWEAPKIKENQLLKYLQEVQSLVDAKGKLKPKKFQQILKVCSNNKLFSKGAVMCFAF